jgi:hypothetical protein
MVDASAAVVAADEREDAFGEYADVVRRERVLPGAPRPTDPSAAGIADAYLFLGMGLTFLGHVALKVLDVATGLALEKGLEKGARDAVAFLRRRLGADTAAEEITERVAATEGLPPEADAAELRAVITIQVTVLIERTPPDDDAS